MSQINRRDVVKSSGAAIVTGTLAGCFGSITGGSGGEYPSQEFTLLNPYSPGGGTDVYFTKFVKVLSEMWEVNVSQQYEPGGGSAKAMRQMGQTDSHHMVGWQDIPIQTILQFKLDQPGFDIRNQKAICSVATLAVNIIVPSGSDYTEFKKLRQAYQNGDISTIGGIGTGSSWHWTTWQMKQKWNLDWDEYIAYDGGGPLKSAVLREEVDAGIILATPIVDFVKEGDLEVVMTVGSQSPSPLPEKVDTPDKFGLDAGPIRASGGELMLSVWGPPVLTDDERATLESDFIEMMNSDSIQSWSEKSGQKVNPKKGSVVRDRLEQSFNLESDFQKFRKQISG